MKDAKNHGNAGTGFADSDEYTRTDHNQPISGFATNRITMTDFEPSIFGIQTVEIPNNARELPEKLGDIKSNTQFGKETKITDNFLNTNTNLNFGLTNFGEYLGSVDIKQFAAISPSNEGFIIQLSENSIKGFTENDILSNIESENITHDSIIVKSDPDEKINKIAESCAERTRKILPYFHAAICLLAETECTYKNCSHFKKHIRHFKNCKSRDCQNNDCVKVRKSLQHFCACLKLECYFCRVLFHEIDIIIDTTNYDCEKFCKKPHNPKNPDDIFDFFFDCYLRFYMKLMPGFDMIPGFSSEVRKRAPPDFFSDKTSPYEKTEENFDPRTLYQEFEKYQKEQNSYTNINEDFGNVIESEKSLNFSNSSPFVTSSEQIKNFDNQKSLMESSNIIISEEKPEKNNSVSTNESLNNTSQDSEDPIAICRKYTEILKKLMALPEAIFFNQPVDPIKLEIPDYFEIIHEPMDFSTIMRKLQNLEYSQHWDVIYDMNLVFDNAYMYNKRVTRVHKCAVKLAQMFNSQTVNIMSKMGYCCNRRMVYSPQVLYCISQDFCVIPIGTWFYKYDDKILYCVNCFEKINSQVVDCTIDENETRQIPKSQFTKIRNNLTVYEPFVFCEVCHKKLHKVCVLHVDTINGTLFYCKNCKESESIPEIQNKFTSKELPTTQLSDYIENRVNSFLVSECKDCNYVRIRMICNVDKILNVSSGLIKRFPNHFPEKFPYRLKALFAFQEVSKKEEVCFFSMHVQEYGIDCAEPNSRRINLSYIDSVHYFRPKHLKTRLYHEILLSYLAYCRMMGFLYCHIWSCPSAEGFDYVFHCHSYEQKLPKPRRLLEWYIKMIELGVQNNIIMEYKDIYSYFEGFIGELAPAIPYFDGDYWSNSLEDLINEHEKERMNTSEFSLDPGLPAKKRASKQKKQPARKPTNGDQTLNQKLMAVMEKYREVFFVIRLNNGDAPFYDDMDPIFQSDLMDGRSGFLALCRENNWEFSSFRHAQYSTKAMMYVVHQQMFNFVEFTCDRCKAVLVDGYHCSTCSNDFDLCEICKTRTGHEHELVPKIYVTFKIGEHGHAPKNVLNGFGISRENTAIFVKTAIHAHLCKNDDCPIQICSIVKTLIKHYIVCPKSDRSKCPMCFGIFKIFTAHAKTCTDNACELPTCAKIKELLRPARVAKSKKIQSRISTMNNKIKEEKQSSEIVVQHRPRKYHVQPDSDDTSTKTIQNPSLLNDPLFAIPPNNVPMNYSLGSLKPNPVNSGKPNMSSNLPQNIPSKLQSNMNQNFPPAISQNIGIQPNIPSNNQNFQQNNSERKTPSQATSRRSRKTETPIQYENSYENPNLRGNFVQQPIQQIHMNPSMNQPMILLNSQGMRIPVNMDPGMMPRAPIMAFDNSRQMEIMNNHMGTQIGTPMGTPLGMLNMNNQDQSGGNFSSPIKSGLGFPNTGGSQNPTPTGQIHRSMSSNEARQPSPMVNPPDQNKHIPNSGASRMLQSSNTQSMPIGSGAINSLGGEMVRMSTGYGQNLGNMGVVSSADYIQNQGMQNAGIQNQGMQNPGMAGNVRQNNQNYVFQAVPMNEAQMMDQMTYMPNGTVIMNNPQSSLNQLSFMTLQQAMQCQNLGVRPQGIVINGAEKQIVQNPGMRGPQMAGMNIVGMQNALQNVGGQQNFVLRPQMRPGMNINPAGFISMPPMHGMGNMNNPRPPNMPAGTFNIQPAVRITRPNPPQNPNPR